MTVLELDRFMGKVDIIPGSCWEWRSGKSKGYGRFWLGGNNRNAYRVLYEHSNGPVPEGLYLDHLCRNRGCVNPKHLEPVTLGENVLRGDTLAAANTAKICCPRGHEYSGVDNRGDRFCRTCMRATNRRFYARGAK